MKIRNTHKRIIVLVTVLGVCFGWYKLKHRFKEPELLYKVPDLALTEKKEVETTKYEEYEAVLENKHKKPIKKSLVRFGLAKLFKPQAVVKTQAQASSTERPKSHDTASKPNTIKREAPAQFYAYQAEEKAIKPTLEKAVFFKAKVYKEQKVRDKSSVIIKLDEKVIFDGKILPAGSLLYGEAKFGKDRLYVKFTVAKKVEECIPVELEGYDEDLLLGWSVPGLTASVRDKLEDKALQKAARSNGSSGILEDLSKGAIETLKEVRKKKEIFLEDRKGVYVRIATRKRK